MTGTRDGLVFLAAGGTGGHLFPAQALAARLEERGRQVAVITDRRGGAISGALGDATVIRVEAGAIAGTGMTKRLVSVARLGVGVLQAYAVLRRHRHATVVGFGGYPSVPAVIAGRAAGLRVVLHEQNTVLGRANRLLAGRADAICTGFTHLEPMGARVTGKVVHTGNPVRAEILAVGDEGYRLPEPDAPLQLLVTGGSQGARVFNELIPAAVEQLPDEVRRRLTVVQQVPGGQEAEVETRYRDRGVACEVSAFFGDMPARLRAAHLIICRAGASTVSELAAAGRPAIVVPYPHATDDHQTRNAEVLAATGGGWAFRQAALTADALAEHMTELFRDSRRLADAAAAARRLAVPDAARRLADVVTGATNGNGRTEREAA